MNIKEIRDMAKDNSPRYNWRLRDLTEEEELDIKTIMVGSIDCLEEALSDLEDGNREGVVGSLRNVIELANRTISVLEK